jgi:hypothetical protein
MATGKANDPLVKAVLKKIAEPYEYFRGQMTPGGLFELLAHHRDAVIVLDDLASLLDSRVAVQLLLAALEQPPEDDPTCSRVVKYRRQGRAECIDFSGGIIAVANRQLPGDAVVGAYRSRVLTFNYDPTDGEIGALLLDLADRFPAGTMRRNPSPPAVAHHVIGEMLRFGCPFDLRLFCDKAMPCAQQFVDNETESHWEALVTAAIRENLVVQHADERPSMEDRQRADCALAREIADKHANREARVLEWKARSGGQSQSTFYRRLAESRSQ